jgi:sec-independent protein translocase protein TatA
MIILFLSPSAGEIFLILIVVLMLFGAKGIPDIARNLGKGIREIKNATSEIQKEITKNVSTESTVKDFQKLKDDLDITKDLH